MPIFTLLNYGGSSSAKLFFNTICLVALYYPFSIGLTFYNKWFIKDFKFPLFVAFCHFIIKFALAALFRLLYYCWAGHSRVVVDWRSYVYKLAPTGVSASVDIGLSNWSLEFITISLYTMSKSSSIVFILLFSVIFAIERLRLSLVSVVVLISVGLFLFTYESTQFDFKGFLLVELAAACCGIRWTLSQLVTQKDKLGLHNPIDMIYHVQPWMMLSLLPLIITFESKSLHHLSLTFTNYSQIELPLINGAYIAIGGFIAFFMEFTEYLLLVQTSSLTLSICGVFKELLTLYLAHHYHKDKMAFINSIGLFVCLCGICLHVFNKARDYSAANDVEKEHRNISITSTNGKRNLDSEKLLKEVEDDDSSEDDVFASNVLLRR